MTQPTYIGIDVAKAELVVATPTTIIGNFPNDHDGHRALIKRLGTLDVQGIVLESTGCYSRAAAVALSEAGFSVAIVQPGRVRHFALSGGVRAKTDAIDARVIAQFGASHKPRVWTTPPAHTTRLRALVDRRDQIIEARKREENHLEACADAGIARELRRVITRLKKDEAAYGKKIAAQLAEHDELRQMSDALQAEAGVGMHTAAVLLSFMPELGRLNRQQVAALIGFAPYNRDSGDQQGKRAIYGGRRRLRRALSMAAISAARSSEWIKPIYQRLRERGKPAKVALVACGRKLAIRLNSIAGAALAQAAAITPSAVHPA